MALTPGLEFDEATHTYQLKGKVLPGVTRVLEPMQELDGIPRFLLDNARERGQHVHRAIHLDIHKTLEMRTLDPLLVNYVLAARKFRQECEVKVLASEYRMADEGLRFAGTMDLMGIMKRLTCVFDYKAVALMPRTAGPQTAAYDYLYRRNMGGRPLKRFGVQLFDDGTYRLYPFEDPRDWNWFASALNIWHWRNSP